MEVLSVYIEVRYIGSYCYNVIEIEPMRNPYRTIVGGSVKLSALFGGRAAVDGSIVTAVAPAVSVSTYIAYVKSQYCACGS